MREKIRTLKIIHLALVAGVGMAYIMNGNWDSLQFPDTSDFTEFGVFLFIPLAAVVFGQVLFTRLVKAIDPESSLDEQYGAYMTASLIRWAFLEGAAFMLLFVVPVFIGVGVLLILYLAFLRPSEARVMRDLDLKSL